MCCRTCYAVKKSRLMGQAIWVHAGPARLPTSRLLAGERGSCHLRCHATEVVQGLPRRLRGTTVINHREASDATAMPRKLFFFPCPCLVAKTASESLSCPRRWAGVWLTFCRARSVQVTSVSYLLVGQRPPPGCLSRYISRQKRPQDSFLGRGKESRRRVATVSYS